MEQNTQAIVIRWRILLQSYPIIAIRHIPRTQNLVADWLSNFYSLFGNMPPSTFLIQQYLQSGEGGGMEVNDLFSITTSHITFEEIMHSVHGSKNLHFGASQTWAAAKANFPTAKSDVRNLHNPYRALVDERPSRDPAIMD